MLKSNKSSTDEQKPTGYVDQEERRKMIEEAAYFISSKEGFTSDPAAAWLAAEKEIDERLKKQDRVRKEEELLVFEHLRKELGKILVNVKRTIPEETIKQAMDEAIQKIKEMGEFTTESVNKGSKALKKDFARAIEELNGTWLSMSGKTAGYFSIWAKRSASFLKQAETAAEHWLKQKGNKINRHTFHSGEITSGGTFACQFCGHIFKQEETDHLPPCPACGETEFKICP